MCNIVWQLDSGAELVVVEKDGGWRQRSQNRGMGRWRGVGTDLKDLRDMNIQERRAAS